MIKKLYIGIDPDLRLINAALITDQKQALAVFKRSNKGLREDKAVAQAVGHVRDLARDISACINALYEAGHLDPACQLVTIVESQNMEHARKMRKKGRKINYQNLLQLGQVAGTIMGALSSISSKTVLVQAQEWKGTLSKQICHPRYYRALGLTPDPEKRVSNIYPEDKESLCHYSQVKINMGDFADINDSLGLALYGAKKNL